MHKRFIALTATLLLCLSAAACSGSSDAETAPAQTTAPVTTTLPTTAPTTVPAETEPAFEPIILADDENATVKITGIDTDDIWGYTLKVFLENKTDKELMYTVDSVSVNGYMCDPFWATTVAAGMKANEKISFSDSDFAENGIETVENITFTLRVYDNEDFMADDLINETITVTP